MMMGVSALTGCGPTDAPKTEAPKTEEAKPDEKTPEKETGNKEAEAEAPVAAAKNVSINLGSEPPEMMSALTTDTTSGTVLRHVVENLVTLDENNRVIPGVAESWEFNEETLTYTFKLRENSKWSTGQPVTANDFVYAWQLLVTPDTAAEYSYFGYILKNGEAIGNGEMDPSELGVKAIDDYTLEVTLERPTSYATSMFAFYVFAPINEEAHAQLGETYGKDAATLPTNGPFNMAEWTHESSIVLQKNPEYWNADKVNLDQITMLMIKDSNAALNEFKTGGAQMIGLNGDQALQLKGEGQEIASYDDGSAWYFEYNTTEPGLNNPKIRQALTLGVDAQLFVEGVVKNNSIVADAFTPPCINGVDGPFSEATGKLINRGDYAYAKELFEEGLEEEGLETLELTYITDDTDTAAKHGAFFQEQWKTNLGIDVKVETMPFKSRLDRMTTKDFSIVMAGWGPDYNDPMTFLDLFVTGGGNNHTSYANPEYDALIKAATEEVDPVKREEILIQVEQLLMQDMPIGPIYNRSRDYIVAPGLTGVIRTAFQDINMIYADYNAQ